MFYSAAWPIANQQHIISQAKALLTGRLLACNLGNMPANYCTPSYLADTARQLAADYDQLSCKVLEPAQLEQLGMHALLAVAQGSTQPAQLISLEYNSHLPQQPIVFVGKGITFDSGGISIKPSASMHKMKYDMCGAAVVIGLMQVVAELKLPLRIVGIVPTCENMPSGTAYRPGDIIRSYSGKTIEITNTDAEGRLILCDALSYAQQTYQPAALIDLATLTGASVVALGKPATGLFSNNDQLAQQLTTAGIAAWDRVWRMPLWEEYADYLDSHVADCKNAGSREAAMNTAAHFLSTFCADDIPWAHMDIASTAWQWDNEALVTARPLPLLTKFLLDYCQ